MASRPVLKKSLKEILQTEEKYTGKKPETSGMQGRAPEMVNVCINIVDHSPLEFFKICLTLKAKITTLSHGVFNICRCN